jgi:hypothetical protein
MLAAVRGRILIVGVSAWLLGAGAATGGSLLAVSLIGQGMTGFSGQQMTGAAVDRALGADTDGPGAGPAASAPSATKPAASKPPATRSPGDTSPTTSSAQPVASPSVTPGAQAAPSTSTGTSPGSDGTVLTSQGGEVVAACQPAGAYLMSWSPQQGYEVNGVIRGPAATAKVTFESAANAVTMLVTCSGGVPSATSYVHSGGGPTDE